MTKKYRLANEFGTRRSDTTSLKKPRWVVLPLLALLAVVSGVCWWSTRVMVKSRTLGRPSEVEYELGKRLLDSARSPEDYLKAANLIRQAAREGNTKAQTGLAVLCFKGLGVSQSQQEGLNWLRKAATQDYAAAQNELGVLYATGKGVQQDLDEAIGWFRKAAGQGSKVAQKNLALIESAKRGLEHALATGDRSSYQNATFQKMTSDGIIVAFEPEKSGIGLAGLKAAEFSEPLKQLCGFTTEKATSAFLAWVHQKSTGAAAL